MCNNALFSWKKIISVLCFSPPVYLISQSKCRMAAKQLWFLLKIRLRHWLLQAQSKLLWSESGKPDRQKWLNWGLYFIVNNFFSLVFCPAGGSSPLVSETVGRDDTVASPCSTWESHCYQPSVWLPVGVPWRQEISGGPALPGPARYGGNSFVTIQWL